MADLTDAPPDERGSMAARQRKDLHEWLREWQYWAGGAVLLVGIWGVRSAADGDLQPFWPAVPLGIWAVVLLAIAILAGRRRLSKQTR